MQPGKTAWLFPGQGSQAVGMGRTLCKEFPPADRILDLAGAMSGLSLKQYCWQGPEEVLRRTDILQPALTAVNLGCVRLLEEAGYRPDRVAGHSLGEFSALYAAGVLTLEDTLQLVIERGRLMHAASQEVTGGMIAIQGLLVTQLEEIAGSVAIGGRIAVANYNAPDQAVLSGTAEGLQEARRRVLEQGGTAVALNVSGPWHNSILQGAAERFAAVLDSVDFRPPHTALYLNTTGAVVSDPGAIRVELARQMVCPVRWSQIIQAMIQEGTRVFLEVGPGRVLRGLLRRIWPEIDAYATRGVDSPRSLEYLSRDEARQSASA